MDTGGFSSATAAADEFNKREIAQKTYARDFINRLCAQGIHLAVVTNKRMKPSTLHPFFILLLIGILSGSEPTCSSRVSAHPPNIVFLIADDWSYPHAGAYGDKVVETPTFDRLAAEGALFRNAYCAAPSCSPSRAAILTGRYPHQLESAANLWSVFPAKFPNWVSRLEEAGYFTGKTRKGWGPGDEKRGGYPHNPAGPHFESFREFLDARPPGKPYCYWFGGYDPHRPYDSSMGIRAGMNLEEVEVPGFLPDRECIRNDILDYYFEVERFDRDCGEIIRRLEKNGEPGNTIIVMTSDNGMPFPRAKASVYDYGTRMPLAISWKGKIKPGTVIGDFMNFVDFAPTFLEAAGLAVPESMYGQSLLPLLLPDNTKLSRRNPARDRVFLERERHANARRGDLGYPIRAIRTRKFLYIRNFEPERWPAGDPGAHQSVGQYGDVDNSITKFLIMDMEGQGGSPDFFQLAFGKRPAEELYQVSNDPYQLDNLAPRPEFRKERKKLRASLAKWMAATGDLRAAEPQTTYWDTVEFTTNFALDNFDLEKEIKNYYFLKPGPGMQFREVPCKED